MSESEQIREQRRQKFLAKMGAKNKQKVNYPSEQDSKTSNPQINTNILNNQFNPNFQNMYSQQNNPNISAMQNNPSNITNNIYNMNMNQIPQYNKPIEQPNSFPKSQTSMNQSNTPLPNSNSTNKTKSNNSMKEYYKNIQNLNKKNDKINDLREFIDAVYITKKLILITLVIMHNLKFPNIEYYKTFFWSFFVTEATGICLKYKFLYDIRTTCSSSTDKSNQGSNDMLSIIGDFAENYAFLDHISQMFLGFKEVFGDFSMVCFINFLMLIILSYI